MKFHRSMLDRLLKEEYGSRLWNRWQSFDSLALFLILLALCVRGSEIFTPSFLFSCFVILLYRWSYYVFEFKLVKRFKNLFIGICVLFAAVLPATSFYLTNSFEYLSSSSAFVQCVLMKQKDIVLISPYRSDGEDLSNHIYMIRKQESVKNMVEILEKETRQQVIVDYQDGKAIKQFKIKTEDKNYIVSIFKNIEYDILMINETYMPI